MDQKPGIRRIRRIGWTAPHARHGTAARAAQGNCRSLRGTARYWRSLIVSLRCMQVQLGTGQDLCATDRPSDLVTRARGVTEQLEGRQFRRVEHSSLPLQLHPAFVSTTTPRHRQPASAPSLHPTKPCTSQDTPDVTPPFCRLFLTTTSSHSCLYPFTHYIAHRRHSTSLEELMLAA